MKNLIALILSISCLVSASAQGVSNYHVRLTGDQVVPQSGSSYTAQGTFTLDTITKIFSGSFFFQSLGATVSVHGPAGLGSLAPVLFDLTPGGIVGPDGNGDPGGQVFTVSRTLTVSEVDQLNANLWYMDMKNQGFPNGEIRGQITAVPEPSSMALLGVGGVACYLARRKKAKST